MARRKLSLKFEEWPAVDQQALLLAIDDRDGGEDIGLAAYWSPAWRQSVIKRYGTWLHWLQRRGELDPAVEPRARVTKERLQAFVLELQGRMGTVAVSGYVLGLSEAIRVMAPNEKRPKFLRRAVRKLARLARPSRDQSHKLVAPSQLYRAGLRRMKKTAAAALADRTIALKFEDGLMIAMLVAKALRRKNFAGMLLEKNIEKNTLDHYVLKFAMSETKNHVRIRAELPTTLTKYIDFYLDELRPMLLRGRSSTAMWITSKGSDMAIMTLYHRFCRATFEETGRRINPHFVRTIVATGVAVATPGEVSITPALLDHKSSQTEKESYNLARRLVASSERIRLLEIRRRRAIDK